MTIYRKLLLKKPDIKTDVLVCEKMGKTNLIMRQYRDSLYIAYPINYYHTPSKKNGGKYDNDGYGTIGMWVSKDGREFEEIKRDYITNGDKWIESCIGHIETDSTFIHYYIPFNNTHAERCVKNTIRARIHYKSKKK